MLYNAMTLGQLKRAVESLIAVLGEDAPVGLRQVQTVDRTVTLCSLDPAVDGQQVPQPAGEYLSDGLQLEWVVVAPPLGLVVGTEAEDYETRKRPEELNAIRIS